MKAINYRNYDYIVKDNIGLVYHIVNRFYVTPFEKDDLIQAGLMGLYYAARRFDENKGFKFSTYATPYILGEIKKELSKLNIIQVNSYFKKIAQRVNQETNKGFKNLATICHTSIENVAIATSFQNQVVLIEPMAFDKISNKKSIIDLFRMNQSNFNQIDNEIFRLRFFNHWNQSEIASKLNIHQSSVSRRLKQMVQIILADL